MRVLSFLTVLLFASSWISSGKAHDNFFLPGDAFFSISITRDVIKEWSENPGPEFEVRYSRFDGKVNAPGSLGYKNLRIRGIDAPFRDALAKAYWRYTALQRPLFRLESDDREDLTQVNGVVALIYSRDFAGLLGLKFNENWQMEGLRQYSGLYKSADPIINDWNFGPEFRPLKLAEKIPPFAHLPGDGEKRTAMVTPIFVNAGDIKLVLVGFAQQDGFEEKQTCPNLQNIYDKTAGTEYIEVDQKGFTFFNCDDKGSWLKSGTVKSDDKSKSNY